MNLYWVDTPSGAPLITPSMLAGFLASSIAIPLSIGSTTLTSLSAPAFSNGSISVTGTVTDSRALFRGFTFTFTATLVLAPFFGVGDTRTVVVVTMAPLALTWTGPGTVSAAMRSIIIGALAGFAEPYIRQAIEGRIQSVLDNEFGVALGALAAGQLQPLPPGTIGTVRGISVLGAGDPANPPGGIL